MNRKLLIVLIAVVCLVCAAGCTGQPQPVKANDTVSVYYTLTLEDGTVRESNVGGTPLTFVAGAGQMIPGFDAAVIGMVPGETKTVVLPPDQAYGEYDNESVYVLPLELLQSYTNGTIEPGLKLMMNLFGGGAMNCEVVTVDGDNAGVLVNHPLAGQALTFEIMLDSVQPA
jgi:peptidylprolyl isomerase